MISQTAEYALRAVVVLGSHHDQPLTTQEIARVSQVPSGYLSKVLQSLGRAGLVGARRGLRGGYVLTRPLEELTVYDVVNAVDPLKRIVHCPLRLSAHAQRLCSLHRRLDDATAMLETYFKQTTIASLLGDRAASQSGPLCDLPGSVR
jgi:Rrf2 family protein